MIMIPKWAREDELNGASCETCGKVLYRDAGTGQWLSVIGNRGAGHDHQPVKPIEPTWRDTGSGPGYVG